jgi:hypothetical protein
MTSKSVYPTKNRPGHEKDLRQAAAGTASNFLDIDSYYQAYQLVKDSCFSDNNSAQEPPNTFEGKAEGMAKKETRMSYVVHIPVDIKRLRKQLPQYTTWLSTSAFTLLSQTFFAFTQIAFNKIIYH